MKSIYLTTSYGKIHVRVPDTEKTTNKVFCIFIHGSSKDSQNTDWWQEFVEHMISVVNPIFIDGMGHGKSIKTHEDAIIDLVTHIEIYKEIIIKLKSQLKLNTFILVGRSLGGQICMNLAQEFQDSIVSLGLIAPSGLKSFENSFNNWEKKISILWDKNDPAVGFSSIKYLDHVEHIKKFIISDSIGEIDPKGNTEICLRDKYKKPSHAPEKQYPNFFFKFLSSLLN